MEDVKKLIDVYFSRCIEKLFKKNFLGGITERLFCFFKNKKRVFRLKKFSIVIKKILYLIKNLIKKHHSLSKRTI